MKKLFIKRSHALDTRHAATCSEKRNSNPTGVRESNRVSQLVFRMMAFLAILFNGSLATLAISPLSFSGSIPENGGKITSFDDVQIMFDFSEIEQEYGSIEGWGVCREGFFMDGLDFFLGATLYEGEEEDNVILSRLANTIYSNDEGYVPNSNIMHLFFPDISVVAGQQYTISISYFNTSVNF